MPHPRRLRFAVELHEPLPGRTWLDSAREVEQLGYSTVFLPDHFDEGPGPIAAAAAFAAVTRTLNVGILVLDCDFRHPAVLARELATIDQIAEGRLEVGLGAGWKKADYDRSGIPMDRPGVRVSRLQEHTAVLRGLWGDGPFSFSGDHYEITELEGTPKPYRPGGPPIVVGGGAPRLLRWAGATADIVGVNASIHSGEIDEAAAHDALADRIDEKVGWVREGAGDRFDDLELNAW
ncbi:MAG TPA: TIGR03621 family F420-dependent LLM class oxidoreductase, partial [Acidimicrobiales bacterium]|nr:TIGR03621 family F420-dependent LLM class oxidoreductase [Acidimicrobiales bacterium]